MTERDICEDCLRPVATAEQWDNEHNDGAGCQCPECVSVCWGDYAFCSSERRERERKRCTACNMPDSAGTLWVVEDEQLMCGSCLRADRDRLLADLKRAQLDALTVNGQCIEEHIWPGHPKYEAMQTIVTAAAQKPPMVGVDSYAGGNERCGYCGSGYRDYHNSDCVHRLAVEFVAAPRLR